MSETEILNEPRKRKEGETKEEYYDYLIHNYGG